MRKLYCLGFFFLIIFSSVRSQIPSREFRAVWISTVANIDWPSSPGLSATEQKNEIGRILDQHKRNNINAVILQVRPAADAIYPSPLEPWSVYLSGEQGIDPGYDPLEYWIEETHKRGMELHAWFNPYRIKQNLEDSLAEDHIYNIHPDWGFVYGTRIYFAPHIPEVWEFVTSVVTDVVRRYDIDAIHFDDYFYPYGIAGEEFPDDSAFAQYGGDFYPDRREDWRRHNVDTIIQILDKAIKSEKPWVKFGISPFGVWRNRSQDPRGSETNAGNNNYDDLYADVLKWQREGWIDYLMPQIYWRDDHPSADFSTLAHWWNDFSYGRGMYIGLAPYRIDKKSEHKLWKKDKYFFKQIELLRTMKNIDGYGFFSSVHLFRDDLKSVNKKIQKNYCTHPAIVPAMPWIDKDAPESPENLRIEDSSIKWDITQADKEMDKGRFFVVYRYETGDKRMLKEADKIVTLTGERELKFSKGIPSGIYRVSALDRLNNESQLSQELVVE